MSTNLKSEATTGVRWTAVSMVGVTLVDTVRLIVLGRLLPPNAFGLMAMMIVIIGFGQIFSQMGLVQAVIQRADPKPDELASLYWLNIASGLSVYTLLFLATPLIAQLYSSLELNSMLPFIGLMFVLNPMGDLHRAMLEKSLFFKPLAWIEMSGAFIGMMASIYLALIGFGVWSLIWGQLGAVVIRNLGFFVMGQRLFSPRLHFRKDDLKGYLRFGLHHAGAMSVNYVNSRFDQLLIGVLLGPQALGYYSMAFNLVMRPVQRINPILTRVAFPVLVQVQNDNERMKKWYFKMLNILTSINAPLLIGISAVAPVAIPLILGEKWLPIVPITQVLAMYSLIRSAGNAGGSVVLAKGRADVSFYWNILLLCFVPAVIFCAASLGDVLTVAWSLFAAQAILVFVWYFVVVRKLLGPCFKGYISAIGIPILLASVMGVVVALSGRVMPFETFLPTLLCQIGVGAVIYLVLYAIFARGAMQEQIRLLLNGA
ncbi:MAG: MOP flippase family protein [Thermodesulfobacteriota bacterium]|nr:MOP flippase family protein [Thermodesulfobacteriota bacterium]